MYIGQIRIYSVAIPRVYHALPISWVAYIRSADALAEEVREKARAFKRWASS